MSGPPLSPKNHLAHDVRNALGTLALSERRIVKGLTEILEAVIITRRAMQRIEAALAAFEGKETACTRTSKQP